MSILSAIGQLKCRARSLQQQADALKEEMDRLQLAAAAEIAQEYIQSYAIASTPSTGTALLCVFVLHPSETTTCILRL